MIALMIACLLACLSSLFVAYKGVTIAIEARDRVSILCDNLESSLKKKKSSTIKKTSTSRKSSKKTK